jgi:hypothetical protein
MPANSFCYPQGNINQAFADGIRTNKLEQLDKKRCRVPESWQRVNTINPAFKQEYYSEADKMALSFRLLQ